MEEKQLSINNEENFVRMRFGRSYAGKEVKAPEGIEKREWGFGSLNRKIESRHFKFASQQELNSYLVRNTPFFISYSTAYYEFPDMRPMEKKNWIGADLVFDLDSNHLEVGCSKKHEQRWVCDECLGAVREETIKLIEEFLIPDFGFSRAEIKVNFSGNRGYHVHIANRAVMELGAYARREIVDFVTGIGIDSESIGFRKERIGDSKMQKLVGPKPSDMGWFGKVARFVIKLANENKLEELGLDQVDARKIYKNREQFVKGIERGNWDVVSIPHKQMVWSSAIDRLKIKLSDKIDQNVTADATKLIRLPDSLHGETGLVAKRVEDINGFNPLKDAIAFGSEPLKIKVNKINRFKINEQEFGPFENESVELPEYAAMYLICKREASLWKS